MRIGQCELTIYHSSPFSLAQDHKTYSFSPSQTVEGNEEATTTPSHPDVGSMWQHDTFTLEANESTSQQNRSEEDDAVDQVDQNIQASPAEVIRKVGKQLNGGQRRTFERRVDLIMLGILEESAADELVNM